MPPMVIDNSPQDERIKGAIDEAIDTIVELMPLPSSVEPIARIAIAFGMQKLLRALGIETGKVTIEAGPAAQIRVVVRR